MRIPVSIFIVLISFVLGGCTRPTANSTTSGPPKEQSDPARTPDQDKNSLAFKTGKAAHEVAKESEKAAKKAAQELREGARKAREGWKDSEREDRAKSK